MNLSHSSKKIEEPRLPLVTNTLFLHPTGDEEIINVIKKLKPKRSSGEDGIPAFIIKECCYELAKPIIDICNAALAQGIFPEIFKVAKVIPIHKKGSKTDVGNYRPISLLSIFSKILEKVVYARLVSFLEKTNILTDSQYGFRKKRNIMCAVESFLNEIHKSREMKVETYGLFLDLSKAFELVHHRKLIQKLESYGIRGHASMWFRSYLANRQQFVQLGGTVSETRPISCGVPQGSILGPILFLLYINDLPSYLAPRKTVLYADDTNILINSNECNVQDTVMDTITKVNQWTLHNNLKINNSKTVIINFNPQLHKHHSEYTFSSGSDILQPRQNTKFLGVWVDEGLKWTKHIAELLTKLNKSVYALRVLSKLISKKALRQAYYALIYSHLKYGIIFWGRAPPAKQLFTLQKRIIRIIANVPALSPSKPLFSQLNLLPLPSVYIFETLQYVKNNMRACEKNLSYHEYGTRSATHYHINAVRLKSTQNSVHYLGLKIYNKLPSHIKDLEGARFKNAVRDLLQKKLYYSLDEYMNT